jgi:PAS domain S-box-containing protein
MTTSSNARLAISCLALALAYYLAARIGLLLAFDATNVSPVWPPSGIALGALLLLGARTWPGIAVGAFAANLVVFLANGALAPGAALLASLGIAAGNTVEALAGMLMLRYAHDAAELRKPHHVYIFAAAATLAAAFGALAGSACLYAAGVAPMAALPTIAATWWVGDLAGMLILTPLILAWRTPWPGRAQIREQAPRAAGALLVLVAVIWLVLARPSNTSERFLVFLLLPCIGAAAYCYRQRGTTLALSLIAGAAVLATVSGRGPFAGGSRNDALFSLEVFLVLSCLVGLVLAADADERARRAHGRRDSWHWLVFFACLLITIGTWQYVERDTEQRAQERFDREVHDAQRRVADRLEVYARALDAARAAVVASDEITARDWHDFVGALDIARKYPGVQVMGLARRVSERALLEQAMRRSGFPQFSIWPPGERPDYVAIVFPEPFSGKNLRVLGFDMKSEPTRSVALVRAMRSGQLAVTGKVTLVQEAGTSPQAGFLMYLPYYRRGAATHDIAARAQSLEGYVYSAFRMNDLMQGILGTAASGVSLDIFDSTSATAATLMYASAAGRTATSVPRYAAHTTVSVGDRIWTLSMHSLPAFEAGIDRGKGLLVLFGGTLITLLLFSTMRALSLTREDALALAESMSGAWRQSERRFAVLVDSASEFSIIATGLDGVITVFSVGAERMTGYSAEQMVGRATPALLHDAAEVAARGTELSSEQGHPVVGFDVFVCEARAGHAETREWTYVRADRSTLLVQLTVNAILDEHRAVVGFLGIARDISEQKLAEQRLRHAKIQADAGSRAKSEFVANMSHELRTPLNAVLGMTQLLARGELSETQRKDVAVISGSSQALLGIVNDILDFSKIEAGQMTLDCGPFRLDDLAAKLASTMSLSARARPLVLTVALDPALPELVWGDVLRLQQVLVNLVGNAIKFTAVGSVAVNLRCTSLSETTAGLQVEVSDTGIGISDSQMATLFAPFSQGDSTTTRRFGGTGLGLVIARQLTGMMGGNLAVNSAEGIGSTFTVTLDLARVAAPALAPASDPLAGLPVLVCEDDTASGVVLGGTLRALGCHAAVLDLAAALSGARVDAVPARVVLLDCALTGADPRALIGAIRAASGAAVVLMRSSFERASAAGDLDLAGADFLLDKPVTSVPLRACLRSLLAAQGGAAVQDSHAEAPTTIHSCTLLVVEDNQLNQMVARRLLESAGARVELAGDGSVALAMLREDPDRYDLVLLDIQMPVMDGFETIARIRGELGLTIPVLAMTAGVMAHERERCISAGMDGFIAKPIDAVQMLAEIGRHLPTGAVPPVSSDPPAGIGCFDVSALIDHMHDRQASQRIMTDLVAKMVEAGTSPLDAMQAAWHAGHKDQAARTMHTLRGSIGSLGAHRFADYGLHLERALHDSDDTARFDSLMVPVRAELVATLGAASRWLSGLPAPAAEPSEGATVTPAQLAQLRRLLGSHSLAACDLFDQIGADLDRVLGAASAERLRAAMRKLDFETAGALLDAAEADESNRSADPIRL